MGRKWFLLLTNIPSRKIEKRRHLILSGKEVNLRKIQGVMNMFVVEENEIREKSFRIQTRGDQGMCSQMRRGVKLILKCLNSYSSMTAER